MEINSIKHKVYINILELINYRHLQVLNPPIKKYNADELERKLVDDNNTITIDCIDAPNHIKREPTDTKIILTAGKEIPNKSKELFNVLKQINIPKNKNLDVIIINEFAYKPNVESVLIDFKKNNPKVNISMYKYDNFIIVIPKHDSVFPHRVMDEDEVNLLLNDLKCEKKSLPMIKLNDPQNIWIGGKVGDVLEIDRHEIICENYGYRVVIK